jgi:hypothetical protein
VIEFYTMGDMSTEDYIRCRWFSVKDASTPLNDDQSCSTDVTEGPLNMQRSYHFQCMGIKLSPQYGWARADPGTYWGIKDWLFCSDGLRYCELDLGGEVPASKDFAY